jgi:hypothetical protein
MNATLLLGKPASIRHKMIVLIGCFVDGRDIVSGDYAEPFDLVELVNRCIIWSVNRW